MAAPQIIRIPILPFRMVNAHLIRGENGCVLVDTGMPGSEFKIARVLSRHGLSLEEIKLTQMRLDGHSNVWWNPVWKYSTWGMGGHYRPQKSGGMPKH